VPSVVHATDASEEEWRQLNLQNQPTRNDSSSHDIPIRKRRLAYACRKRGWAECGEFLSHFAASEHWEELNQPDQLDGLERLLQCDDMFIMRIVAGIKETPPELESDALQEMQKFAQVPSRKNSPI
jgi:succinate dehydrogenase flavin-adding protein (antitoxin of CptAB toxin-antitoxin module)